MNTILERFAAVGAATTIALTMALGEQPPAKKPDAAANDPAKQGKSGPEGASASEPGGARGPVIDGERFTMRQLLDQQQGGIPVCVYIAPEKWRDRSQVIWNYQNNSNPVTAAASVENPANEEAFFLYPQWLFFCLRPDTTYYQQGQNFGGLIFMHQRMPPEQTLLAFVQQARGRFPQFKVIGSKDLPELPGALKMDKSPNQRGVGIRVTYEVNSKPVEEEFYAVPDSVDIPYDGPQGRTWQNNWGLLFLHSFRAPAGTLDKRRAIFASIPKSFRRNPVWDQRKAAVLAYLQAEFNRQLQAGYDQIAAAAQLSRQISANNDAMLASIDRQLAAARTSGNSTSGGSGGRSPVEKFDDYIRGVDTVDDPYYGTSQHAYTEKYHWTDGYGTYRHSNDASYNPNQSENGDWRLMQPTR